MIYKHFPAGHTLHKILNRNNIKVSYSCMENMATIIKRHNNKAHNLSQHTIHVKMQLPEERRATAKWRLPKEKPDIPSYSRFNFKPRDQDLHRNVRGELKTRHNDHSMSFKHKKYSTKTAVSKHIWKLKWNMSDYSIQ